MGKHFEELYLSLDVLVELLSLKRTAGTLSETYFDIERIGANGKLTRLQLLFSLLETVKESIVLLIS
jgi:hypothetical protein